METMEIRKIKFKSIGKAVLQYLHHFPVILGNMDKYPSTCVKQRKIDNKLLLESQLEVCIKKTQHLGNAYDCRLSLQAFLGLYKPL